MRVVRINAVYGLSSTGRTVKQLDEGLKNLGVDSTTVYFAGSGTERDLKINTAPGVKLHGVAARLTGKAGYYSAHATKQLIEYLDSQGPDVVHLHNLHSNFVCLPMLFEYLAAKGIPTAVTLHDCWWYTGKCTHYTVDGCTKWQRGCGGCPRLKKDIPSWAFDRTQSMLADKRQWFSGLHPLAVIGVSDWITGEAKKSILKDADIIRRVYNWIDTEAFAPVESDVKRRHGIEGKYTVLAVASQWMASKGLNEFIGLARRLPDDAALVMIGRMPEDLGGLPANVTVVPATHDQHELARWYSAADVHVSLSREESFGKVTAEALACGTPVISLNSTASPELVGEGCGVVADSAEPDTVLRAIGEVRRRGKAAMSRACRQFALQNFRMEANIAATADIYKELIAMRKGGK